MTFIRYCSQTGMLSIGDAGKAPLLHEMAKHNAKRGLAMLCTDGGMHMAMYVERN
jgi:hypothetical protein